VVNWFGKKVGMYLCLDCAAAASRITLRIEVLKIRAKRLVRQSVVDSDGRVHAIN
jgi:hypothetical protein